MNKIKSSYKNYKIDIFRQMKVDKDDQNILRCGGRINNNTIKQNCHSSIFIADKIQIYYFSCFVYSNKSTTWSSKQYHNSKKSNLLGSKDSQVAKTILCKCVT